MRKDLAKAAAHLVRDFGKPIRAFSGASIIGHTVWIATYHDGATDCKTFSGEDAFGKVLEAVANLWGESMEYPLPDINKYKAKNEELHLNGCQVITSIKVLDGSGYHIALRFPEEVPNWEARKLVTILGPKLIQEAEDAYNTNSKLK